MNISKGQKIFNIFNVLILFVLVILCVYPVYYVVIASISEPTEIMKNSGILLHPLGISWASYKSCFQEPVKKSL